VPLTFYGLGVVALVGSVSSLVQHASLGNIAVALFGLIILALALSETRLASAVDDSLIVRSLFRRDSVDVRACVFSFTVVPHVRGGNAYPIQAHDVSRKAKVDEAWTQWGAQRDCRRLSETFAGVANQHVAAQAIAEQHARAQRDAVWARQARAEQQVKAYYASGAALSTGLIVLVLALVAAAGVAVYAYFWMN